VPWHSINTFIFHWTISKTGVLVGRVPDGENKFVKGIHVKVYFHGCDIFSEDTSKALDKATSDVEDGVVCIVVLIVIEEEREVLENRGV
jgi:hypothetical protein